MELNQIRYFVELARLLNFTRAAENCGVTQPALTRGIQQLEKELGGPLLHRERSHTQLTELGRILLPSLERAFMASQEAKLQAEAFQKRDSSPLRVGLEHSIPTAIITPVIATLRRNCDEIELALRQESGAVLCERMLAGELDFALLVDSLQISGKLHRWRLFDEDYVVVCPSDHRFKDSDTVDLAELASECLLLHQDPACPTRRFVTELCAQESIHPRRQHFGSGFEQILEMVQATLGISVAGARTPLTPMFLSRRFAAAGCSRTVILSCVAGRRMGPTPSLFMKRCVRVAGPPLLEAAMSIESGLRQRLAEMMELRPRRYRDMLGVLAQRLNATARDAIVKAGDRMPDFVLPTAMGELIFSGDLLRQGPLVVVFFRGDWCPFCQETLRALNAALPDIEAAGAVLVAITPDTGDYLHRASADLGLRFHVLCDVDSATALRFGTIYRVPDDLIEYWRSLHIDIDERHGDSDKFLPMPSTFVVDQSGIVRFSYASGDITDRVEPEVICSLASAQ